MRKYAHEKIEKKWQERWRTDGLYNTPDHKAGAENFYTIVEFPYPSGNLHVGHWYAFAVPDIFVRMKRMQGYNVMFPIGFDAFGLPAENAAIKRGINPKSWTEDNMTYMRRQLESMGASFDWSREVATCDPRYYKWTQWFFLHFFKKGLAYQAETDANWCPSCKTVLANEQVIGGHCERCGSEIEQKKMKQWMYKITEYADRLLVGLTTLPWPEAIKEAQRNWIGKSEGARISFSIESGHSAIEVFTTRPDTIFGATYLVLAPEHSFLKEHKEHIENWTEVENYISRASKKTALERQQGEKQKTGVELKGVRAINPATKQTIPIFTADYVLSSYGTGAIMAVPAHDDRDFAFAKKFGLPIKQVIAPRFTQTREPGVYRPGNETIEKDGIIAIIKHWKEEKYLGLVWKTVDWGTFLTGAVDRGFTPEETVMKEIQEETGYVHSKIISKLGVVDGLFFHVPKNQNTLVHGNIYYVELEDGERMDVSPDETAKHELKWFSLDELKTFLTPDTHQYALSIFAHGYTPHTGVGSLVDSDEFSGKDSVEVQKAITEFVGGQWTTQYRLRDWVLSRQRYWGVPIPIVHCDECGPQPVRETELPVMLPEIQDYLPSGDGQSPLAKAVDWVQVTCPHCKGPALRETDTMDTFVDSSWYFLRYTDPNNEAQFASPEKLDAWMPVDRYSGGAEHTTMHLLYSRFLIKVLHDLSLLKWDEPYIERYNRGIILGPDGQKMSKSKGNVIEPDDYVKKLGSDTVRMYLAFIGPYDHVGSYPWDPRGILGIRRFLERVWRMQDRVQKEGTLSSEASQHLNRTVKKIAQDNEAFHFNTAVSELMKLSNVFTKEERIPLESFNIFLKLLSPFAPHMTEELWEIMGNSYSIHQSSWPVYDEQEVVSPVSEIVVQINGKVRGKITLEGTISEESAIEAATSEPKLSAYLGNGFEKAIYVPGKLINFVVPK